MDAFLSMADGGAANIYARVERWAFDEVALPGKLVREIVESLYRENQFCRGMLKVRQQIVGPENLSAPTLAVVNTADVVAPLHSVSLIGEALGPEKFHIIEYPGETGVCLQHLGILVGRHAHARVWHRSSSGSCFNMSGDRSCADEFSLERPDGERVVGRGAPIARYFRPLAKHPAALGLSMTPLRWSRPPGVILC